MKKETKDPADKSSLRKKYKSPELIQYGSLSKLTTATSGGTILDGGTQPNKNLKMN